MSLRGVREDSSIGVRGFSERRSSSALDLLGTAEFRKEPATVLMKGNDNPRISGSGVSRFSQPATRRRSGDHGEVGRDRVGRRAVNACGLGEFGPRVERLGNRPQRDFRARHGEAVSDGQQV